MKTQLTTPAAQASYLLQHLSATLSKQSDQVLMERLGVGFSQFKILKIVRQHPQATQISIAQQLGQTEASISRQVKLLEQRGMLSIFVNPANRRERHSRLTPKGERLVQEVMRVLGELYEPMFDTLGDKRQKQLIETLHDMHQQICVTGKIGACQHNA